MTVFTVTIIQGQYEDRTEITLIFSSLDKVWEWKDSYKTPTDSYYCNGVERAIVREVEVDTNEVIAISDSFYLDTEKTPINTPLPEDDLAALKELKAKLEANNSSL